MGIEARVTEREQAGRQVYRVRVGPVQQARTTPTAARKSWTPAASKPRWCASSGSAAAAGRRNLRAPRRLRQRLKERTQHESTRVFRRPPPAAGRCCPGPARRWRWRSAQPEDGKDYLHAGQARRRSRRRPARSRWSSSSGTAARTATPSSRKLVSLDQEAAAPTWCSAACRWPSATTSCRSSACTTRWRPWARWTSCTPRCSTPSTRTSSRLNQRRRRSWPGPRRTAWTRPSSPELYNSFSVSDQGAPRHAAAGRLQGRRRAGPGHRRPLLHRRHPGRQHGPRAAGRRYLVAEARKAK